MGAVGTGVPRKEAKDKVTGNIKFVGDYISPGLMHARLVTGTYAHALLKNIQTAAAWRVPGVKAIVTGKDCSFLTGAYLEDRPPLAADKVRYYGEPVALVVADSELAAKQGAEEVRIEYEPLPAVNSVHDALRPGAPRIHENLGEYRRVKPVFPETNSNIADRVKVRKGDMGKGWAGSEITVEASFHLPQSDHVAMETRCVRAEIAPDGRVTIHSSSQAPFVIRKLISRYFLIDTGKITVIVPAVGGSFGGKAAVQLELLAYMASQAVGGRQVKLVNTREQEIISSPGRIGLDAEVRLGATKEGQLMAAEITYLVDGGAYSDIGAVMTKSIAADCTGPYKIDNVQCDALCVYTNHPYTTSYTGFGHASYTFAIERTLDMLAKKLKMDPWQLRRMNAIAPGDTSPTLTGLTTSNLGDTGKCLDRVKQLINWDEGQVVTGQDGKIRAKGLSALWKTSSTPTDARSGAILTFNPDGSLNIGVGAVEIGQGSKTNLAVMAAERLKMDVGKVHVMMEVNTHAHPEHFKTVASMTTFMAGRAVLEACDDIIHQLLSMASIVLRCSPEDLDVAGGRVFLTDNPNMYVDITELVHGYKYENGNSIGGQVIGRGSYIMRHLTEMDPETGKGNVGPGWTVGAEAVEVEFDPGDFTYKMLKAVAVLDAGKVINPRIAQAVVMGRMNMGLSLANREGLIYSGSGVVENASLRDYKIMRFAEQPQYTVEFIETPQIDAPYGARGLGEHGLIGMPAALGNALSAAARVELNQLPLLPETIWSVKEGRP
ncbi:xanthine dehydrogenase molybdenum-binding subunit [Peptococcaceae bacterium CEB3]|nr:xanthine dehydrogenase molybdenum-binding subunit [Peptococcaceae bacterium CEB3]